MKKLLVTLSLVTVILFAAKAQTRVGGHLAYGTEIESLGIGALGEFFLNEKMAISPGLIFFFPKSEGPLKLTWWELNANFNYYFIPDGSVNLYGIAGLNFASLNVKYDGPGNDFSDSDSEIGLNLGIGTNFILQNDKVVPFGELKFVVGDADQVVLSFGAKFNLR